MKNLPNPLSTFVYMIALVLFGCITPEKVFAQKKTKKVTEDPVEYPEIEKMYKKAILIYQNRGEDGKTLALKLKSDYIKEVKSFLADSVAFITPTEEYPIVRYLFKHMLAASTAKPDTMGSCLPLKAAMDNWKYLNSTSVTDEFREAIVRQYKLSFGLSIPKDIEKFYDSNFSKKHSLAAFPDCDCCIKKDSMKTLPSDSTNGTGNTIVPKPPKKETAKYSKIVSETGDMVYRIYEDSAIITNNTGVVLGKGKTPAEALLKAINSRKFKTRYLEVRPVILGQFGNLPKDKHGSFYEILLHGSTTGDTLLFGPGEFWFTPNGSSDNGQRWGEYQTAIIEFSKLLAQPLGEFGPQVYEFALYGSADATPLSSRKFPENLKDDPDLRSIDYVNFYDTGGSFKYITENWKIGDRYNNNDLPMLRAAYIRKALLDEPLLANYRDRVRIIKGKIEQHDNKAYRNCAILLYINQDLINGKFKPNSSQPHSPYGAKP